MSEQAGDNRDRHPVHYRMARHRMPQVVKATVLDAGLAPHAIPKRKVRVAWTRGIEQRGKDEWAACARLSVENGSGLAAQRYRPPPRLAVGKNEPIVLHFRPAKARNLTLAAAGEQQKADDVRLLSVTLPAGIAYRSQDLGPVDRFDQDEGSGEGNERAEVCGGFFAAQGDAFEAFELADGLFDAGPSSVERPCEALWPVPGVLSVGNDRQGASFPGELAVSGAVIALVGNDDAGPDIGAEVHQGFEMRAVCRLAAGQVEGDRQAVEIRLQVDFRAETAPRAPERLTLLPPFAPAAETCARVTVESNI